ncbi:MAG: hypothetical protein ACW98F_04085 [Candidatus Hodarchaeales archaeon]|jgi:hypothetical protein
MSVSEDFFQLIEYFLKKKDVKKQGKSLKIHKKMFAMFTKKDEFVVKLSEERVKKLVDTGIGLPYDSGTGKYMKEWVIIPPSTLETWIEYSQEAKTFVTTKGRK